ncbi:acyl-CoA synthetase (AMP-forming)/AMP-acid ligase II [Paenibacillus cellulosilyticus]|uniref:Acyl-CoA synthetase (AMP-forming)/AMP-acid ligase II n=1 Tax=Paenibacillus cellulosilyticus TaxID=375489 RepID=A0A2V2YY25_9BACL|nr:fatty acid--CoA ligase family protein [Paenibacillus cellulosilyticus]PWW06543.1 acyl-CoA synthetase (AMP-forming)/AMP-acid ligase II [Paenibacillus cellulosilyticus]QKS46121.1 long-chain fatty acid--CoA ligase [Paenibacillus cellulosilyticus]
MRIHEGAFERVALRCGSEQRTYRQLIDVVKSKVNELDRLACIRKRVVVDLPDSFTMLEWVYALWQRENSLLLLDPRLTAAEKADRERMFRPEAGVSVQNGVASAAFGVFSPQVDAELALYHVEEQISQTESPEQDALIQFSSGSSGIPKMIVRSKHSILAELEDYATEPYSPGTDSMVLCLVPLCHSFGLLSSAIHTLSHGGTLVFPEMLKPGIIMQTIVEQQITHVYGVAFHYQLLANEWDKQLETEHRWHPELRLLCSGGPFPETLLQTMLSRGLPVGQQYGMSEVGYIAVQWSGLPIGSVGSIAKRLQAEVTDEGELVLALNQSPYRFEQAQWVPHSGTDREAYAGGRLFTQDLVSLDELGRLYIGKRKNDQVSIGGLKVAISEIEQVLRTHPQIVDACVVSYEQPSSGTVLEAFVVSHEAAELAESIIKEWLSDRLARYKIPRRIRFINEIPVSPAGKIIRGVLLKEYCHEPAAAN